MNQNPAPVPWCSGNANHLGWPLSFLDITFDGLRWNTNSAHWGCSLSCDRLPWKPTRSHVPMQNAQDWGFEAMNMLVRGRGLCCVYSRLRNSRNDSSIFSKKLLKGKLPSFITIPRFFQPIRLSTSQQQNSLCQNKGTNMFPCQTLYPTEYFTHTISNIPHRKA